MTLCARCDEGKEANSEQIACGKISYPIFVANNTAVLKITVIY